MGKQKYAVKRVRIAPTPLEEHLGQILAVRAEKKTMTQ